MMIVVLGGGIDIEGKLPSHVLLRLEKALELYAHTSDSQIILSGKYSFLYPKDKFPLSTEAEAMKAYLIQKGVLPQHLLTENDSKDTIGNAYYLKTNFFIPRHIYSATVISSEIQMHRVEYIFKKVFGRNHQFTFIGVPEELDPQEEINVRKRQIYLLEETQHFLSKMRDGDHSYLAHRLYNASYYRKKRPDWVVSFVAKGKP